MEVQNLLVEGGSRPKIKLYGDVPETQADDAWNVGDRTETLGGVQTAWVSMIAGIGAVVNIRYVSCNTCQVHVLKYIEIPYRIL